jgi:hypothetical protein
MIDEEPGHVRRPRFEWIANLWRPREQQEFVPRRELHNELARKSGLHDAAALQLTDDDIDWLQMAHKGIDLELDNFAQSGPDEAAFRSLSEFDEEPSQYWRHKITRDGVVGYVRSQDLTEEEAEAIRSRFRRIGEATFRMANTLVN